MKKGYFHRVAELTPTRFWINNVTEKEALLALEAGAVGCTQNPSYVNKMLTDPDWSSTALECLDEILKTEKDPNMAQELLQNQLVGKIAKLFMPLWEKSNGKWGYVSIQSSPLNESTDYILKIARMNKEISPNIMIKIPATPEGLEAIEVLIAEGVAINATEVMTVRQAMDVCDVYDKVASKMKNPPVVYLSHIAGILDDYLRSYVEKKNIDINPDVLWQGGIIAARKVRRLMDERDTAVGLIEGGARGLHHFTEMVGSKCCVTINWNGTADKLIEQNNPVVDRYNVHSQEGVVDELLEKMEDYRRCWYVNGLEPSEYEDFGAVVLFRTMFEDNWEKAIEIIKKRLA